MNESLRIPIAILVSLVCHIALLTWIVHLVKVPVPYGQGSLRVFLRSNVQEPEIRPVHLPVTTSAAAIKTPEAKQVKPVAETSAPSSSGNSIGQAPQFSPSDMMNSMQLAQLAHQREMSRMAIMVQMSDIAARLRPLVTGSVSCELQKGGEIDCTPEPGAKLRLLLEQYSRLVYEARQMGVAGNQDRIDFGQGKGVSVKLTNP